MPLDQDTGRAEKLKIASEAVIEIDESRDSRRRARATKADLTEALRREENHSRADLRVLPDHRGHVAQPPAPSEQTWGEGEILSLDSAQLSRLHRRPLPMAIHGEPDAELETCWLTSRKSSAPR